MTIAEPVTLLTDYALAGVTGWLGWRLLKVREAHTARLLWAVAFTALAAAAAVGGTYHGFAPLLPDGVVYLLWKVTVLAVGIASFSMFSGSVMATTADGVRKLLLAIAVAKLTLYAVWMLGHDDFLFVIVDTGTAMAGVAALHGWSAAHDGDSASLWMLVAVGVSALAAAVQASGFALHQHFNHNDLYHVIQIVAMTLFYKGAKLLRDHVSTT